MEKEIVIPVEQIFRVQIIFPIEMIDENDSMKVTGKGKMPDGDIVDFNVFCSGFKDNDASWLGKSFDKKDVVFNEKHGFEFLGIEIDNTDHDYIDVGNCDIVAIPRKIFLSCKKYQ